MTRQYKYTLAIFCLAAAVLPNLTAQATENDLYMTDYYGPIVKKAPEPATFTYNQDHERKSFSIKGKLSKSSNTSTGHHSMGLNTSYTQLFHLKGNGYLGFSHLSGRVDDKNKVRLNTSVGRYLPDLNSELFLSYRLYGANVSSTFDNLGYAEEYSYENSFAASYTTFIDSFLREASVRYAYSFLPGQDIGEASYIPAGTTFTQYTGGFSDTQSHALDADVAFGSERLPLDFLTGFKVDLGVGYEHISHANYYDLEGEVLQGVSGKAIIQHQTVIGLLKGSYKLGQSSATLSASLDLGNVELYMKDVDSYEGDDTKVYGVSLNMNLYNLANLFSPTRTTLFSPPAKRYSSVEQAHHFSSFTSDSFKKSPKLRETNQLIYAQNNY